MIVAPPKSGVRGQAQGLVDEDTPFERELSLTRSGVRDFSVGIVGTYPPTKCGIATFTASLAKAVVSAAPACRFGVLACADQPSRASLSPDVVGELVAGSAASREAAVAALDEFDVVVVQHEFGIFGGDDGCEIIDLVAELSAPVIVVLHTIPRRPSPGQQAVVEQLAELAERVVTQSLAARTRLLETHAVEPEKVCMIPHGAPANLSTDPGARDPARSPVILTWGLLGPSKGIEWGIEAMALLRDLEPRPRYVVAGQTHPRIIERQGEEYRDSLVARAAALGISHLVEFDGVYRSPKASLALIHEADIVLLPYRSREQVVSGVLVEAIASGKPVVSTGFPHARELLGQGSGIIVGHGDVEAIAAALHRLLTDPELSFRMAAAARRQAPGLFWGNVGENYVQLVREVAPDPQWVAR